MATVEDSGRVNPYRYGVLEGNHVEERFSIDHLANRVSTAYSEKKSASMFNNEG